MSDSENNVVSIATRRAVEPTEIETPDPTQPCQHTIDMVEALLERAKSGELEGLVFLSSNRVTERFSFGLLMPPSRNVHDEIFRFSGGMNLLKRALLDIGEDIGGYGMSDAEEDFE